MKFHKHLIIFLISVTVFLVLFFYLIDSSQSAESDSPILLYNPAFLQQNLILNLIDSYNPKLHSQQKFAICQTVISEAQAAGFDPFFVSSVIAVESSFYPKAVSPCEAQGLMQLTSGVIRIMNVNNPFDIKENIKAGTRYLKDLRQRFGKYELILAAYNAGPTRVQRLGRIPRIRETLVYVKKVHKFHRKLHEKLSATMQELITKPIIISSILSNAHPNLFLSMNSGLIRPAVKPVSYLVLDLWDNRRLFRCIVKA